MNSKMLNLCSPVRLALVAMGVSTVNVVNAINAQRGECGLVSEKAKAGTPKGNQKKGVYSIGETRSLKYEGELNEPRSFDVWHSMIEKANTFAGFDTVAIPTVYHAWLNKFTAKTDAKADKAGKAEKLTPEVAAPVAQ